MFKLEGAEILVVELCKFLGTIFVKKIKIPSFIQNIKK